MKLPSDLLQKAQNDYVGKKYREGLYTFQSLDEETIVTIINSFFEWAHEKGHINDHEKTMDVKFLDKWMK